RKATNAKRVKDQMLEARPNLAQAPRVPPPENLPAAIAHEINQPLAAAVTGGRACLRWLDHDPPNVEEARSLVEGMIESGTQAGEVISRLRTMMRKSATQKELLNINDAILAVITLVNAEA